MIRKALGVVGNVYGHIKLVAFSFFDAVVIKERTIYRLTRQFTHSGQYVWILAKLPGSIRIIKDDVVEKFLLCLTHNGSTLRLPGVIRIAWCV